MRSKKRSFLMSLMSLILCVAMLVGSTFAWFTDTVTSGVNKIVAGNLDVELWHTSKSVVTAQQITDGSENLLFKDVDLWEPGAYAYETFTVKNVGNLALKYKMSLNIIDYSSFNGHDLTEVLKVAVVDTPPASRSYFGGIPLKDWSYSGGAANTSLYPVNSALGSPSETNFTVVVYWEPTDHDDDFNMNNGRPQPLYVDLGVNLIATQLVAEPDSFDNQYDKDADNTLPTVTAKEKAMFAAISRKLAEDGTEDLKVEKSGVFEEATVPAKVANAMFDKVFEETAETVTDKSLTLILNVEKTGEARTETDTKINYTIDMDAVIKEITGAEVTKSETKPVDELGVVFDDFVEIQLKVDAGLVDVGVKHNDSDMTEAQSKADIPISDQDPDGYFHYIKDDGLLTLWTKTFSPFTVTGTLPGEQGTITNPFRITNGEEWTAVPEHVIDGTMTYFIVENGITLTGDELLNIPANMQVTIDMNNCSVSAGGNYAPVTNWGTLSLHDGSMDTMNVDGYTCVHNHGFMTLEKIEIHSTWSAVYNYNESPDTPAVLEVTDSKLYGNNVAIYNGSVDDDYVPNNFGKVIINSGTFESVGFGDNDLGWDAIVNQKGSSVIIYSATVIDGSYASVFTPKGLMDVGSTVVNAYEIDDIYTEWGFPAMKTVYVIAPSDTVECTLQFEGEAAISYASLINAIEHFKTSGKNAVIRLEKDFTTEQFGLFILPGLDFEAPMGALTFDLNGHTYTSTEYNLSNSGYPGQQGTTVTIIDSSTSQTGKYFMSNVSEYVFSVTTGGILNIESGTIENACSQASNYLFYVGGNGTVNISGGTISEKKENVTNEATRKKTIFTMSGTTAVVNITGGSICGMDFALTQEFVDHVQSRISSGNYAAAIEDAAVVIRYREN